MLVPRLIQKYQNTKKELEAQQNLERINRHKQTSAKFRGGKTRTPTKAKAVK